MDTKTIGDLLVRITTRCVGSSDGSISVRRAFIDFLQRWGLGAALRDRDLHVIFAVVDIFLHPGYKLLIAQKSVGLEESAFHEVVWVNRSNRVIFCR